MLRSTTGLPRYARAPRHGPLALSEIEQSDPSLHCFTGNVLIGAYEFEREAEPISHKCGIKISLGSSAVF